MKNVLLSADGDIKVYSVPDMVEKNLEEIADEGVTGEARLVQYHDAEQDGVDGIEEEGEVV